MNNLPTRESQVEIVSKLRKDPKGELLAYVVLDDHGYIICEINITTPEDIVHQIAVAIKEARDIGFEQGRKHIRKALGVI
jgi:hypothetical protein